MTYEAGKTQVIRRQRPPVMGWVAIVSGLRAGALEPIRLDGTVLGRDADCDIQLDEETVSGRHAKIWAQEPQDAEDTWHFYIQDMASTNGTYVNGEEILRAEIKDNDVIELGKAKLVFKCIELPRQRS